MSANASGRSTAWAAAVKWAWTGRGQTSKSNAQAKAARWRLEASRYLEDGESRPGDHNTTLRLPAMDSSRSTAQLLTTLSGPLLMLCFSCPLNMPAQVPTGGWSRDSPGSEV